MDDSSKNMMLALATGIAKKALITLSASAATHGIINSNQTETFVSVGLFGLGIVWSIWNDYGKAIVLSQLEILKAKSLAQAAKLNQAGLPPVTASQIADQSPTLTTAEVTKTIATLPPAIQQTVAKVVIGAMVLIGLFAMPDYAHAQTKLNLPIDPLHLNGAKVTGNASVDMQAIWQKIVASSIVDLNYAAAMADSAKTTTSGVRLQCLKAIITLNEQASGANLKNPDGSPMARPDPHLFTDVESLAEIVDNLSPQGPLFVNCAGAAQLAKTNVLSFVNAVVTGAAGLAAMPIIPGL